MNLYCEVVQEHAVTLGKVARTLAGAFSAAKRRAIDCAGVGRIPALDGLRGIAILLVIAGHTLSSAMYRGAPAYLGHMASMAGVAIFLSLSGFLVTRVMLIDERKVGRLRLGRFYFRRALRIFPAFYTFLGITALVSWLGWIPSEDHSTWMASAFYLRNIIGEGWATGHLWSLSPEEQFYLLWPVLFVFLGNRRRRLWFIAAVAAICTSLRIQWLAGVQDSAANNVVTAIHYWPQMRMDTFLVAAAFAIADWRWPVELRPLAILPFLIAWHLLAIFSKATLALQCAITSFVVCSLIVWVIKSPQASGVRWLLCQPAIVWLGTISYGLYLWQQLFTGPNPKWWGISAAMISAIASYHFVEQPFLRWKNRHSKTDQGEQDVPVPQRHARFVGGQALYHRFWDSRTTRK